jgi:hypothetical protein
MPHAPGSQISGLRGVAESPLCVPERYERPGRRAIGDMPGRPHMFHTVPTSLVSYPILPLCDTGEAERMPEIPPSS